MWLKIKKCLLISVLVAVITGFTKQPSQLYQTTNGKISFRSDAPFEIIKASSDELMGLIDISKNNFSLKINVYSFEGFNSPLQKEHFNENYMESDKYPYASFSGKIIEDVDLSADGDYEIRAKGNLTIHNVSRERIIKTTVTVKHNTISIHSSFTVLLSDHNIPIPKVVYQKLANEIKVEVNASFEPK
jgi:polyisoprenoid-binding protein YceI